VLRKNNNMINENVLEEVYVVGHTTIGQNSDSSGESDIEHDKRRLALPFYDACHPMEYRGHAGLYKIR
jgi:hypothetical protein